MKTHTYLYKTVLIASRSLLAVLGLSLATATCMAADAAENYGKHCAACHGKDGKGETKAGKKAGAKDLTDAALQTSLTDDKIFKSVKEGIKEGEKEKMKPFAEKLTDDEIKALVPQIRSFKK